MNYSYLIASWNIFVMANKLASKGEILCLCVCVCDKADNVRKRVG